MDITEFLIDWCQSHPVEALCGLSASTLVIDCGGRHGIRVRLVI